MNAGQGHSGILNTKVQHRSRVGDQRRGELGAAAAFLRSTLPGERKAARQAIGILLTTSPSRLSDLKHGQRRFMAAAKVLVTARYGSVDDAVALVEAELERGLTEKDPQLPGGTLALWWAAAAEAYLTAGFARRAGHMGWRACRYAEETGDPALRYRTYGIHAAALALNGDYLQAELAARRAASLESEHSWQETSGSSPLRIARLLLAFSRLDARQLAVVAQELVDTRLESPASITMAALAQTAAALVEGRPSDGIAAITAVSNDAIPNTIDMLQDFLLLQHAGLLVARGEPYKALLILDPLRSHPEHTFCVGSHRASAHLQLGANREALTSTDDCIRLGMRHCLRTLPEVLLQRAIANERLGYREAADIAFLDAFQLVRRSTTVSPLLALPRSEIQALTTRMCTARPDLAPEAEQLRQRAFLVPAAKRPSLLIPSLTNRETVVAHRLRGPETLSQIAASLFVSRNTVKSQVSRLYRKLGTTNRRSTVSLLEQAGFYE